MDYTNSKLECPVCALLFAKNYLICHLTKQHANIYQTEAWEQSRYNKNFIEIKRLHKEKYNIKDKPVE